MDGTLVTAIASLGVAVIAGGSAELSRRAAAKATRQNSTETLEREAYRRAEEMLGRQFQRQEEEIQGLHEDVQRLQTRVRELEDGREEDQRIIAARDEEIRTMAAVIARRGLDLS